MAKQQTRYPDTVTTWEQISASVEANSTELAHLEAPRLKLVGILEQVRTLSKEHDLHTANKQQAAQRLKTLLADGRKLATFLRAGIKEHYGNRNEKIVEFGLQTFRRRKREPAVVKPPETPVPVPDVPAKPVA